MIEALAMTMAEETTLQAVIGLLIVGVVVALMAVAMGGEDEALKERMTIRDEHGNVTHDHLGKLTPDPLPDCAYCGQMIQKHWMGAWMHYDRTGWCYDTDGRPVDVSPTPQENTQWD